MYLLQIPQIHNVVESSELSSKEFVEFNDKPRRNLGKKKCPIDIFEGHSDVNVKL